MIKKTTSLICDLIILAKKTITKEVVNMILSQKIENNYKNCIENIKKVENKLEKSKMVKALISDLGGKGISIIARLLNMAFNTVKSYYLTDFDNVQGIVQK